MVHWYDFILRLGVAIRAGALIGLERQWRSRGAGLRTNTLAAAGGKHDYGDRFRVGTRCAQTKAPSERGHF